METSAWHEVAAMSLCEINHSVTIVLSVCFYNEDLGKLFDFDTDDPREKHLNMQHNVSTLSL
jgi:hypothetical protein